MSEYLSAEVERNSTDTYVIGTRERDHVPTQKRTTDYRTEHIIIIMMHIQRERDRGGATGRARQGLVLSRKL